MGTVFKKTVTKALPAGAEIFTRKGERLARWKDRKGKTRTAPLTTGTDGADRIVIESSKYIAKYRDGAGIVREVATGCRDETAARQVLADLERRAELVRSNMMTPGEDRVGRHQATALDEHFHTYLEHAAAAGHSPEHRANVACHLNRLAADCSFRSLRDLQREALERWLAAQAGNGMGARTRNTYRAAAVAFCNWCVETNRLTSNPFTAAPKADEKADRRRQRRAMTEEELVQLLTVARERPLLDALTVRKGQRKGERYANVRPEVRDQMEWLGRERALIYKTLLLTGLRKGELASLTVVQLTLDAPVSFAVLDAADEKSREGNEVPLREDLAADLRGWLADKLQRLQAEARERGEPIPARLPAEMPLFTVPAGLHRILDRDLVMAGLARWIKVGNKWKIDKRDERGRTLDVHALRHTFGTLLSKGGVSPRTAQAAMRHSDINLTMNVYTDPRLLDIHGALGALPLLPLDGTGRDTAAATGTDDATAALVQALAPKFAPGFAPTRCKLVQSGTIPDKSGTATTGNSLVSTAAVSSSAVKTKQPLTSTVSGCPEVSPTGVEPVTFSSGG